MYTYGPRILYNIYTIKYFKHVELAQLQTKKCVPEELFNIWSRNISGIDIFQSSFMFENTQMHSYIISIYND